MLRAALLALLSPATAMNDPPKVPIPDFVNLDCSLSQLAFQFGSKKVPSSPAALHDALNLGSCATHMDAATLAENARILAAAPPVRGELPSAGTTLYVAMTGSDSGPGTEAAPFASLQGAAAAIRKAGSSGSTTVLVRAGKYYFNKTLALGKADSNVRWAAYRGEKVTLSGGKLLSPDWKPYKGKIQMASVSPSDVLSASELEYLAAPAPAPAPHNFGKPPAQWNTMHVDGVRQVRARTPNGNPQHGSGICFSKINRPGEGCDSYLQARGGLGCTFDPAGHNRMDNCTSLPDGPPGAEVSFGLNRGSSPTQGCKQCTTYGQFKYGIFTPPDGHPVYNKPLPGIGWQNNSLFSFWGSPFSRPAGVQYNASDNVPKLAKADGAVVHMFHGGLWGGWQYSVAGQTDSALEFGYGGYQEARGSTISRNHYYVENDLALLDSPSEWYYDPAGTLYYWPNATEGETEVVAPKEVVAPLLDTIVSIKGASDVSFVGFEFTETRSTYLSQYQVPSGGDWSIHRGAAFFVEDSSAVNITDCSFNQTGGNAVMFSNNVVDSAVTHSEFVHIGDSAIATLGSTDRIFGTAPTFPNRILIANNHIREVGIYGKQTSCYFQAIAANVTLKDNLCYNGPRAGINWNDGFAGNNLIEGNLVFNMVRETGDHGPFNSWDRQPYLTNNGVDDGLKSSQKYGSSGSIIKKNDFVTKNFWLNGYNGVWTIDHDDGSQYWNDTMNLMAFGGCKNYLGHSKSCDHNVIIFPGDYDNNGVERGSNPCQTDDSSNFGNQYHDNNHCFTTDGDFYSMGGWTECQPGGGHGPEGHVFQTWNNTFYSPKAVWGQQKNPHPYPCKDFVAWQAAGQDRGSVVKDLPGTDEIVAMGKALLGM